MRRCILILLIMLLPAFLTAGTVSASGSIDVCFTPGEDCTGKIVREIYEAKNEILVQAYSFTSNPIAKALLNAHKRGVKIEAILDKSQRKERYTSATFMRNAGIQVLIDDRHAIAHNKIMIIDRKVLITGSFNFTKAAQERNAENLLVIKGNKMLLERYLENYAAHRLHAEDYR